MSSDRSFLLVFVLVFLIVSIWPAFSGDDVRLWAFFTAIMLLIIASFNPAIAHPLNILWHKFGLLLHKITNPLLLGVVFFGIIAPIGFLYKVIGKDVLKLRYDERLPSYWIISSEESDSESFNNQF